MSVYACVCVRVCKADQLGHGRIQSTYYGSHITAETIRREGDGGKCVRGIEEDRVGSFGQLACSGGHEDLDIFPAHM